MNEDDEYGFWDDDRGRSMTGPITRPQRAIRKHSPEPGRPAGSPGSHGSPDDQLDQGPTPRRRSLASFWSRVGMLALVGVLAVSVAVAVGQQSPLSRVVEHEAQDRADALAASVPDAVALDPSTLPATGDAPAADGIAVVVADTVAVNSVAVDSAATPAAAPPVTAETAVQPPAAPAPQSRAIIEEVSSKRACAKSYKVVGRDYWILIAKKTSVSLKALLAANNATTKTPLYAGRTVCLPANASTPTTAKVAAVNAKPKSGTNSSANNSSVGTKPAPTQTKPTPTTAAPTPPPPPAQTYSAAEVEQIIRDVWPDDLEDRAVAIAKRESNLVPTARNSCCIGLFQLYWNVHRSWMSAVGVSSAERLYDPRVNATVAYALYLRSGGWGPWGG